MAENQLVAQAVAHLLDVERPGLAAYLGIKEYVEQHVAQFLANILLVVTHQCVAEFVDFFDGVGAQALIGLLAVPRTFHPQFVEHIEQSPEGFQLFLSCMHIGSY